MNLFTNPQEARAYVVAKILEQAATEQVELSDFERKLLNECLPEEEIEAFDEGEDAEDFWHKIALLVRHGLQCEKERGGRSAQRGYEEALRLTATIPDYLAGIIQVEQLSTCTLASKIEHGYRRWLLLIPVCLFGGIALAASLFGLFALKEYFEETSGGKALLASIQNYGLVILLTAPLAFYLFTTLWRKARTSQTNDKT